MSSLRRRLTLSRFTKDLPCFLSSNSAPFPSPPTRSPCCWRFGPRWRSARGRRGGEGLDGDHIYNAGLYGLVAGFVAARLAHVIVYWDAYRTQLLEIFGFNQRAFLLWPGVIAALAVAAGMSTGTGCRWSRCWTPSRRACWLGIAIADVAALLTGRNAGAPARLPWAVNLWGVARHPVRSTRRWLRWPWLALASCG